MLPSSQFLCFGVTDASGLFQIPASCQQFADCILSAHISVFAAAAFLLFWMSLYVSSLSHFHTNLPTIQVKRMEACLISQPAHECKS